MTTEYKNYMQKSTHMMVRPYIKNEDVSGMTSIEADSPEVGDYVGYFVDNVDAFYIMGKSFFEDDFSLLEQHLATASAPFYCSAMGVGSNIVCAKQAMLNGG